MHGSAGAAPIIPVTGGGFTIDCANPATYSYVAPTFTVDFANLCTYEAAIDVIRAPQLPGGLPDGVTLAEAIQIVVTDDGQSLDPLPANARITVKFEIPAGQQSATYAILFWDDGKWVELSGEMTDDGFFTAAAENAGTFVLVKK